MNRSRHVSAIFGEGLRSLSRREDTMRARKLAAVIGIAAAALWAPVASAAIPVTTIRIEVQFGGTEEFFASGGVVCSHGFAITDPVFIAGFGRQGRGVGTFHLVKTMTCDNGDTFKLLVDAAGSRTSPGTVGGFAAGQGTGSLAGLHGGGSLVGTGYPDGSGLTDIYTGRLTIAP
jgi:hypothetical protein